MFYYRNSGGYRRPRGIYGFPWFLLFIFMFSFHSWGVFLTILFVVFFINLLIRAVASTKPSANTPPYQPRNGNAQPYYQPYQQPYQPYQQGYQTPQETYTEAGQQYQYPDPSNYEEYEQPQAQYPEQMPPMQQE
jgi:hypothetical protein